MRQIVKELLPEIIKQELFSVIQKSVDERILSIEANVKQTLHELNERHKDTMSYLVRQVTAPAKSEIEVKNE